MLMRNNMMNLGKKGISLLLALLMMTSCAGLIAFADAEENCTEHVPGEPARENEVAATCTEAGSYDEVIYCTVCGEELSRETVTVDALGHTEGDPTKENEIAATCTEAGSYDEVIYCTVCGEELSREAITAEEALGHRWDEGKVTAEATADAEGVRIFTCTVCGETRTEIIERITPITPEKPEIEYPAFEQFQNLDGIVITANAEEGIFPEGAVLSVREVTSTQEEIPLDAESADNKVVVASYTFFIQVMDPETEEEYLAANGQNVRLSFAMTEMVDENLDMRVYRVEKETGMIIEGPFDVTTESSEEGGKTITAVVEYDGSSFYTVEFTYNKREYVMTVDSAAAVSDDSSAKTSGTHEDSVTWMLDSENVLIISGTGAMTDYGDYSVVPWYDDIDSIRTVVIEPGVTSIGNNAFYGLVSLENVTIPQGVISIGDNAFYGCSRLTSVIIPDGVTTIGEDAFCECSSLTSVTFPSSVTSMGGPSDRIIFDGCTSLETEQYNEMKSVVAD